MSYRCHALAALVSVSISWAAADGVAQTTCNPPLSLCGTGPNAGKCVPAAMCTASGCMTGLVKCTVGINNGSCVPSSACTASAECKWPQVKCNTGANAGKCVVPTQCNAAPTCATGLVNCTKGANNGKCVPSAECKDYTLEERVKLLEDRVTALEKK